MSAHRRHPTLLPLLLAGLLALPAGAGAEDAGIAGAVNNAVTGTPPGGSASDLEVGTVVVRDETIVSNPDGLAQLLFLDQTTLTVGPNSEVVIDEFVYDPAANEGQLLMETSVGVFRLIGGSTAATGGITVTTPLATMGIRGSNVVWSVEPNGRTRITCNYCERVEIQLVTDPDQLVVIFGTDRFRTIEIGPDGFTAPFELTDEEVAQLQALLTSPPGRNGGIANIPIQGEVEEKVVTGDNSDKTPGENDPNAKPPVQQAYDDQLIPNPQEQTEAGQDQNEEALDEGEEGEGPGEPEEPIAYSGRMVREPAESGTGWTGDPADPDHTQTVVSGSLEDSGEGQVIVLQLSDGGTLTLPYQTGGFSFGDVGDSPFGTVAGEGFVSPTGEFFYYRLTEQSSERRQLVFGGQALASVATFQPVMAFDLQPDQLLNGAAPFLREEITSIAPENVVTTPLYFVADDPAGGTNLGQYGVAALGFEGTGPGQTSLLMVATYQGTSGEGGTSLSGNVRAFVYENEEMLYVTGGSTGIDGGDSVFYGGDDGVFFVVGSNKWQSGSNFDTLYEIRTADGGESAVGYDPVQVATPSTTPLPDGFGDGRVTATRTGFAAGLLDPSSPQPFGTLAGTMTMQLQADGDAGATMQLQGRSAAEGPTTFEEVTLQFAQPLYIDRTRIMMQEGPDSSFLASDFTFEFEVEAERAEGALVSYDLVQLPGNELPGGVTPCTCAFMEWGFWAYSMEGSAEADTYIANVPIGSWVTGEQVIDPADLPDGGSASYEGHALAHIVSTVDGQTSAYTAAGLFFLDADFDERSVTGGINDLDGRDYSFASSGGDLAPTFQASGGSSDLQVGIGLNGAFFNGPFGAQSGVGGVFTLDPDTEGLDYYGSGTFAGEIVPN